MTHTSGSLRVGWVCASRSVPSVACHAFGGSSEVALDGLYRRGGDRASPGGARIRRGMGCGMRTARAEREVAVNLESYPAEVSLAGDTSPRREYIVLLWVKSGPSPREWKARCFRASMTIAEARDLEITIKWAVNRNVIGGGSVIIPLLAEQRAHGHGE